MKRTLWAAIAAVCLLLALPCSAQTGYVTLQASHLQDSNGATITNATASFCPANSVGTALSFRVNGAGQSTTRCVSMPVSDGALPGSWPADNDPTAAGSNLIPDPVLLPGWTTWTNGGTGWSVVTGSGTNTFLVQPGAGATSWSASASGGTETQIAVSPGGVYTFSGYIGAMGVTAGRPAWVVEVPAGSAILAAVTGAPGTAGRYSVQFTVPHGVTGVYVVASVNGAVISNSPGVVFGQPLLEAGASQLADTNLTFPQNVCFAMSVTDNTTGNSLWGPGYNCLQPAYNTSSPNNWCSAGLCNLDNYEPTSTPLALVQPGPQGQGFTVKGAWQPNTAYSNNDNGNYDCVTYSGSTYCANSSFTSGSSFNSANWTQLVSGGVSLTQPLVLSPSASPSSALGYSSVNGAGIYSTSSLSPGLLVQQSSTDVWGIDLGYYSSRYGTRLFAPDTGAIQFGFYPHGTGSAPTAQSSFSNYPLVVLPTGLLFNQPLLSALNVNLASYPANALAYSNVNGGRLYSSSSLAPGILVGSNPTDVFGMDWGYNANNSDNTFGTRIFASSSYEIMNCFHAAGTTPTVQSSFNNCPLVIKPTGINLWQPFLTQVGMEAGFSVTTPSVANVTGYSNVNGLNLYSATNLVPGLLVGNPTGGPFGMDLGYYNSTYATRVFAPSAYNIVDCFTSTTTPTAQSNFSNCPWVVGAAGATANQPVTFNSAVNYTQSTQVPYNAPWQISDPQQGGQAVPYAFARMSIDDRADPRSSRTTTYGATAIHSFGDSITQGVGATSCSSNASTGTCYANLIAATLGLAETNNGSSGDQACDMALKIFSDENPAASGNPLFTAMIGTNDTVYKGVGAYEAIYQTCYSAGLAWLAVPSTAKVAGNSGSVTTTGTTAADTTFSQVTGVQSTTSGSTMSFAITSYGGPIYAWYRIIDGNGGTFTWQLDGGAATSLNAFTSPAIATNKGATTGVALLRITNVAAGAHTLKFTVTSATGAGNIVSVLAAGTPPANSYYVGPVVAAGIPIYQLNDANSNSSAQYVVDAAAVIRQLASDGLDVRLVDTRAVMHLGNTTEMNTGQGTLHPSDVGHAEIAGAFVATLRSVPGKNVTRGTPASSAALCTPGDLWADASYVYTCVASGQIKRSAVSSF